LVIVRMPTLKTPLRTFRFSNAWDNIIDVSLRIFFSSWFPLLSYYGI
jgi:hypothetical protein